MNTKKNVIVLNRMYVGKYIFNNLGHEIINMYAADNGNHYLYLNATGNFEKSHKDKIDTMLLTKSYKQNIVEVIGLATGLKDVPGAEKSLGRNYKEKNNDILQEQKNYIENEGKISYGGASILDIFNDAEQQSIFITYKAEKFYKPKRRIFIAFCIDSDNKELPNDSEHLVKLTQLNWAKTSLKQYLYPKDATNEDYKTIENLVKNSDLWKEDNTKADSNVDIAQREISLIDICQIQNDENCFSNMLAYFMQQKQYRKLWTEFFKSLGITLEENYSVTREKSAKIENNDNQDYNPNGGRMDIFISDNNKNMIVIENKIKSDINDIGTDENNNTQLRRYYNYVNWLRRDESDENLNPPHFLILTPNYNIPEIEEEKDGNQKLLVPQMKDIYKIITYNKLYDFLSAKMNEFNGDANFKAFYEAIKRHTYQNVNAYLYNEMEEKFIRRIKEINGQKYFSTDNFILSAEY